MKDIEPKKRPCRSSRTENSRTRGGGQRKNAGCTRPWTVRFEIGAPNASLAADTESSEDRVAPKEFDSAAAPRMCHF